MIPAQSTIEFGLPDEVLCAEDDPEVSTVNLEIDYLDFPTDVFSSPDQVPAFGCEHHFD